MALDHKDGVEDVIPDFAGDPETEIEVLVVVREMVLLHLPHVLRQFRVVEGVMHAVVQYI